MIKEEIKYGPHVNVSTADSFDEVLALPNRSVVTDSLSKILEIDFERIVKENPMVKEAVALIEGGTWPMEFLEAIFSVLEELANEYDFGFHHFGFLQPDAATFDTSTANFDGEIIPSVFHDHRGEEHYRKYIRFKNVGPDIFLEFAKAGKKGDGRTGVHFDLVHEKAGEILKLIKEKLDVIAEKLGATVFEVYFGGGDGPIGKVGIKFDKKPNSDVGIMFRNHYSDPKDWK